MPTEPRLCPAGAFVGWDSVEDAEDAVERLVPRLRSRELGALFAGTRIEIGARRGPGSDDALILNPPFLGHPWRPLQENAGEGAKVLDDFGAIVSMEPCGCHRRVDDETVLCAAHLEVLNAPVQDTRLAWSCPKCEESGILDFDDLFAFPGKHMCLEGRGPFARVVKLDVRELTDEEKERS